MLLFEELGKRSVNFIKSCLHHDSQLVSFIVRHDVYCSLSSSFLCQNITFKCNFCARRYHCSLHELVNCSMKSIIAKAINDRVDSEHSQKDNRLLEMLLLRDGLSYQSEMEHMIYEIAVG